MTAAPHGPVGELAVPVAPSRRRPRVRIPLGPHWAAGDSKTDTVNRAVQLYAFIVAAQAAGQDVLIRTPGSDELEKIILT